MIVVGVDPGIVETGYVFINDNTDLLQSGIYRPEYSDINEAIGAVYSWYKERFVEVQLVRQNPCEKLILSIEIPYVAKNKKTAIQQAQVVGAIKSAAIGCKLYVVDIAPARAKLELTGSGLSGKDLMVELAKRMYPDHSWNETLADALGIAMAGLSMWIQDELLQDS